MSFFCTICEEESTQICVSCAKDTCGNHLCRKCARCSDCCSCDVSLDSDEFQPEIVKGPEPAAAGESVA
jgi:hypothetical protein